MLGLYGSEENLQTGEHIFQRMRDNPLERENIKTFLSIYSNLILFLLYILYVS